MKRDHCFWKTIKSACGLKTCLSSEKFGGSLCDETFESFPISIRYQHSQKDGHGHDNRMFWDTAPQWQSYIFRTL